MPLGLSGDGLITGFDPTASGFGKVLQVVRATDTTDRSTSSTTYVDAGISVTITPQKSTSAILLIWLFRMTNNTLSNRTMYFAITDNSNNVISGSEAGHGGSDNANFKSNLIGIAYATPGTTSAVTYKGRYKVSAAAAIGVENSSNTGQMFAIEVAA